MKTVMVHLKSGHVCGSACRNGSTAAALAKTVGAAVAKGVEAALRKAPGVQQRVPSLVEEVAAELQRPGNERIIALVDEAGHVTTLMGVKPYFEQPARNRTLPPEERTALEAERKELIQSLPNMVWKDRVRAQQRIRQIERDLDVLRFNDESERRHREREAERQRERYGAE